MNARILHYSYRAIAALEDKEQVGPEHKPRGFWVSVEDGWGWKDWCAAESFQGGWSHAYKVALAPDANLLWLTSGIDIDCFHHQYAVRARYASYPDWHRVAFDYDGIIIAPYQWTRRLDGIAHDWYYSWDCSSGCIWRVRAIESLTDVSERELAVA